MPPGNRNHRLSSLARECVVCHDESRLRGPYFAGSLFMLFMLFMPQDRLIAGRRSGIFWPER